MDILHAMANALMKYETLDRAQVDAIMRGERPPPPADWTDDDSSQGGKGSPTKSWPLGECSGDDGVLGTEQPVPTNLN